MQEFRVFFDKLDGQSYKLGNIILKAIFLNRQVTIKTNFNEIAELQKNLAQQLGNIYTDRFQAIELDQLEACGGILLDYFFEDALSYEFITHNDYFKQFFSNAQRIDFNEQNQNIISANKPQVVQQQTQQNNQQRKEQMNPISEIKGILVELLNVLVKFFFLIEDSEQAILDVQNDEDKLKNPVQNQKKLRFVYNIENNTFNEDEFIENEEIEIVNPSEKKLSIAPKTQRKNMKQSYLKKKIVQPSQNIYLNNRQLLEEKINQDKKYIHSSKYFRLKIKKKLKFLYKIRQNLPGQTILNCFSCYKCHKNMYFGIKCFKCKRDDMYFCEDCNTKCPLCLVLLKKTNDHVNITNFYRLMSSSKITCQACIEEIPLIKYEDHLHQCEDNMKNCKHCRINLHYSQLKNHVASDCDQRPIVCNVCNAKYPKYKQTSHKCIKRFYIIQRQLENNFDSIKQQIDNQFNSLQNRLKEMQQISNQSNKIQ